MSMFKFWGKFYSYIHIFVSIFIIYLSLFKIWLFPKCCQFVNTVGCVCERNVCIDRTSLSSCNSWLFTWNAYDMGVASGVFNTYISNYLKQILDSFSTFPRRASLPQSKLVVVCESWNLQWRRVYRHRKLWWDSLPITTTLVLQSTKTPMSLIPIATLQDF